MPVCNKCKKYSDGQTVDWCTNCGARDWFDAATFKIPADEPKVEATTKSDESSQNAEGIGCLLILGFLAAIAYGVYYFFLMPDDQKLANEYNIPAERVSAPAMPHGCAFNDAPLGNKHCHYEKHVYVYDRSGQIIEVDDKPQICPSCSAAYSVEQVFVKVEE